MADSTLRSDAVKLDVKNIGGISDTTVEFDPGVTLLTGRNATNRTSLLQSIMAALGGDNATIKGDADVGEVELQIGDRMYTRRLTKENGTTVLSGEPYLEDETVADLFAFLLESNRARQAVIRGSDLREIIMEPIDTHEIETQIEQFRSRRESLDDKIASVKTQKQRLPELEGAKHRLEQDRDDIERDLADIRRQIQDTERDVEQERAEKERLEARLDDLNDARNELESVRQNIATQKNSIEALENEKEQLEAERAESETVSQGRIEGIEAEVQRLREQKEGVNRTINELQTVIEFNEGLLDGSLDFLDEFDTDADTETVTSQILPDDHDLICWTCGTETESGQIESMVTNLEQLREEYMSRRTDIDSQIEELKQQRQSLKQRRQENAEIDERLVTIGDEIDSRETRITELQERRSSLTDQVETLEAAVAELRDVDGQDDELLELHGEANRLEVELERLESEREDKQTEIDAIEDRTADLESFESQREEVQQEIEGLRTRVETLEEVAAAQFNEHMESVLEILGYENIERIWIERITQTGDSGRTVDTEGKFELHIVRSTADGAVYEDTVDHLSESEREVTGLVFALAGYLVHEVSEKVPFMLLDSVESIDAPRLAKLVRYFEDHTDYFVVALLEEDARELDDRYHRITNI